MSSKESPGAPVSRQKVVGEAVRQETRARILRAAAQVFATHDYRETTVARLASAAEVSVQTLYATWGSKRQLLRGYFEDALSGGAGSPEDAARRFDGLAPAERLEELAAVMTEVAGRAATGWRLYRDAAAVDPEVAADWDELQRLRRGLIARILGEIPERLLAPGLTRESAVDTAWVLASPESHELLVRRLGYSLEEYREWMAGRLRRALLDS